MALKEDIRRFSELCKECNGQCCKGCKDSIIPLSKQEARYLKQFHELKIELGKIGDSKMNFFKLNGDCYFLTDKGCKLGDKKPVNCKMFPLIFEYDKEIKFYFDDSDTCQFTKEIQRLNDWKTETLKETLEEVSTWSEEEKVFFSELCRDIKKKKV